MTSEIEVQLGPWPQQVTTSAFPDLLVKEGWLELEDADIDWLAKHGNTQSYPKKIEIIKESETASNVYIMLEGLARVSAESGFVTSLNTGCVAGELGFLSRRVPCATVYALPDSIVFTISIDSLNKRCIKDLGFSARWTKVLGAFAADRLQSHLRQKKSYNPSFEVQEKFTQFLSRLAEA